MRVPKVGDWISLSGCWSTYHQVCRVVGDTLWVRTASGSGEWAYPIASNWIFRDPEPTKGLLFTPDMLANCVLVKGQKVKDDAVVCLTGRGYNEFLTTEEKYKALKAAVQQLGEEE